MEYDLVVSLSIFLFSFFLFLLCFDIVRIFCLYFLKCWALLNKSFPEQVLGDSADALALRIEFYFLVMTPALFRGARFEKLGHVHKNVFLFPHARLFESGAILEEKHQIVSIFLQSPSSLCCRSVCAVDPFICSPNFGHLKKIIGLTFSELLHCYLEN